VAHSALFESNGAQRDQKGSKGIDRRSGRGRRKLEKGRPGRAHKHHFLMLELLIALFLVGVCALPLAQLPINAVRQEIESSYHIGIQRLADLAFAQIKEKLYRGEITWQEISRSSSNKFMLSDDTDSISFDPLGTQEFNRKRFLYSVGKKGKQGEEWRLVTFKVMFKPRGKKYRFFSGKKKAKTTHVFTYQTQVHKSNISALTPLVGEEMKDHQINKSKLN
jgi:hypothetical protein